MKAAALFVLTLLVVLPGLGAPPITSTFDTGLDGWTAPPGGPGSGLTWDPAGHLVATGVPYLDSPFSYGGDRSMSYGAEFSFSLRMLSQTASGSGRVRLTGASNPPYLEWSFPVPEVAGDWQTIRVSLPAGAGWVVPSATPRPATEAEIRAVLANLSFIQILFPVEVILGIDNVSLGVLDPPPPGVPVPPSAILVAAGLGSAAVYQIRRRLLRRVRCN